MAYIRDIKTFGGNGTSVTPPSGLDYAEDDLLLFVCFKDVNLGAWSTPAGYTSQENTLASSIATALFTKVATASESAPTSTSTDAARDLGCYWISVADVDGTTPVNDTNTASVSTSAQATAAITTTANDCLVMHFQFNDTGGVGRNCAPPHELMLLPLIYSKQSRLDFSRKLRRCNFSDIR